MCEIPEFTRLIRYKCKRFCGLYNIKTVTQDPMYRTRNSPIQLSVVVTLCLLFFSISSSTTKGRVIELDSDSLTYLSHSFDQILVLFLEDRDDEIESIYQQHVKAINDTYGQKDHTLYGVSYFSKDPEGKLAQFDNKRAGFRIITRKNHYSMDFDPKGEHRLRQFQMLQRFYSSHVHPVLPILAPEQFGTIETDYFLAMEYNSTSSLQTYIQIYPKLYDYLKLFNVRAVAVDKPDSKSSRICLFNKKHSMSEPLVVYANELNNTDEIIDFVNVETLPLLTELDDTNYIRVFGSFLDTQLLLIYEESDKHDSQIEKVREELRKAAKFNKEEELKYQRVLFAEASTKFLSKYFDDSVKDLKNSETEQTHKYRVVITKTDYGQFQLRKFYFEPHQYNQGVTNKENILQFIEDVRMKRVESQFMSEQVPSEAEQQNKTLRKIVGDSFIEEIYEKPDQSIVVLFIDSKEPNAHKDIMEAFENFTKDYREILEGKMVSAVFDLAKNEHKMLTIRTAPELVLFGRANKKKPSFYRGYAKASQIKDWINYEAKDVTIPDNYGEKVLPLGGGPPSETASTPKKQASKEEKRQTIDNIQL